MFVYEILRYYVLVPQVLQVWQTIFTLRCFLPHAPSPHFSPYREGYWFERTFLAYTPSLHLLPYRELYWFERTFLPCTPSPHLLPYREWYWFERTFLPYNPSQHFSTRISCTNLYLSRLRLPVLLWRLQCLPLKLEAKTPRICLLESHSVQQKVLFGRFFSRAKAIRNTISAFGRFWIYNLIHICIVMCM